MGIGPISVKREVRAILTMFLLKDPHGSQLSSIKLASKYCYLNLQIEGRLSSVVHHSSPVEEGDSYKITLRLSTYNPVNTEGTVTVLDRLTDKQYDIHVHVTAGNFTSGLFSQYQTVPGRVA